MTKDALGKLRDAFLMGFSDREACLYAQINPDTLYEYQKQNGEFSEQKKLWKQNPVLKAKKTIYDDLSNTGTAKWYLERKARAEFDTRLKEEHITGPLVVIKKIFVPTGVKVAEDKANHT